MVEKTGEDSYKSLCGNLDFIRCEKKIFLDENCEKNFFGEIFFSPQKWLIYIPFERFIKKNLEFFASVDCKVQKNETWTKIGLFFQAASEAALLTLGL